MCFNVCYGQLRSLENEKMSEQLFWFSNKKQHRCTKVFCKFWSKTLIVCSVSFVIAYVKQHQLIALAKGEMVSQVEKECKNNRKFRLNLKYMTGGKAVKMMDGETVDEVTKFHIFHW